MEYSAPQRAFCCQSFRSRSSASRQTRASGESWDSYLTHRHILVSAEIHLKNKDPCSSLSNRVILECDLFIGSSSDAVGMRLQPFGQCISNHCRFAWNRARRSTAGEWLTAPALCCWHQWQRLSRAPKLWPKLRGQHQVHDQSASWCHSEPRQWRDVLPGACCGWWKRFKQWDFCHYAVAHSEPSWFKVWR
jgi:hypothetical protein